MKPENSSFSVTNSQGNIPPVEIRVSNPQKKDSKLTNLSKTVGSFFKSVKSRVFSSKDSSQTVNGPNSSKKNLAKITKKATPDNSKKINEKGTGILIPEDGLDTDESSFDSDAVKFTLTKQKNNDYEKKISGDDEIISMDENYDDIMDSEVFSESSGNEEYYDAYDEDDEFGIIRPAGLENANSSNIINQSEELDQIPVGNNVPIAQSGDLKAEQLNVPDGQPDVPIPEIVAEPPPVNILQPLTPAAIVAIQNHFSTDPNRDDPKVPPQQRLVNMMDYIKNNYAIDPKKFKIDFELNGAPKATKVEPYYIGSETFFKTGFTATITFEDEKGFTPVDPGTGKPLKIEFKRDIFSLMKNPTMIAEYANAYGNGFVDIALAKINEEHNGSLNLNNLNPEARNAVIDSALKQSSFAVGLKKDANGKTITDAAGRPILESLKAKDPVTKAEIALECFEPI